MQEVLSLFQDGFPDFRMLGIWGMGGIGKTTLADAIYHHVSNGFQRCCFLANVREQEEQRELLKLRKEFLSTILEDENLYISTPTIGSGFLTDRLSKKKVLIVCDDVSKLSQLEFLFGGINRFGPGSRVIVTTRNKQVLVRCGIDLIYDVKELDEDESVQLFCQCAFKSNNPTEYQLKLSKMVLSVANGNPLAIRLVPKQDIQEVLKWSFDGLDCEEKEMFLDIACFFKGKHRDYVTSIMDACYDSAHSGIENLIDKSLISVSQNQIAMHDLLQQMGWNIVRDESPLKLEKRSRLWIPEDSYSVLSENNDLVNLKIIRLDGSQNLVRIPDPSSATNLEKIDLWGCSNLRELPSSLQHLEKLSFLNFRSCKNLRSLPSFYKDTSLTELDIRGCSNLYSFPEIMDTMESLRHLYLSGTALKELPSSIENLIGLKQLRLKNYKKLVCLSDSFYKLKSLKRFYLKGCSRLETFPEIIDNMEMLRDDLKGSDLKELPSSIDNLISLVDLKLKNCCSRLETFPEIMDTMERLRRLDLDQTALKELPSSIDNLIGLEELVLNNCENLVCLPDNFYKLKSLKRLTLQDCSRLEIFPEILETMERLRDLDLSGTALKELPSSVENLIGLEYLILENCENLVCLPDNFYKLKSLNIFDLE
ncbi:disease resistance protein RUN1-like, partial [Gossypium hirsutum]|uniref:Disease resistance protein RUN1-like n=1 Tax=Gossypium hirsutum TaxID=3635 RepID=A0ABM3BHE6_GOSHI